LLLANGEYTGTIQVNQKSTAVLHKAAGVGSIPIVQEILVEGVDVNARDHLG
jgi:hypothetical protein